MADAWVRCERAGCDTRLSGRQVRFCSPACRAADYRASQREPERRTCALCGDPFAVRYRNQSVCDYNSRQASDECMELQDDREDDREAEQYAREHITCERDGCDVPIYRPGRGRPRRFCSEAHKKAHQRANRT